MSDTQDAPTLTAEPPSRGSRWTVRRVDGNGSERLDPADGAQVRRAARALGVSELEVRAAIDTARLAIEAARPVVVPASERAPVQVYGQTPGDDPPPAYYAGLQAALDGSPHEFWNWQDSDRLSALDVDVFADGPGFSQADLDAALIVAAPMPAWAWVTRGRGARLMFEADETLSARERAALYALLVPRLTYDTRVEKVELLTNTRRPPPTSSVFRGYAPYGVPNMLGALLRTGGRDAAPQEAIDSWLAERGMRIGERFGHDRCPIDPTSTSGSPPVVVMDDGVMCYRCAGMSPRGGWRPWSALVGPQVPGARPEPPPHVQAACRWVHWQHARLVLLAIRPRVPEHVLRVAYAALLKLVHAERWAEPETQQANAAVWDPTLAVVRGSGAWLHADSLTAHSAIGLMTLKQLPSCRSPAEVERYMTEAKLEGYAPIEPVAHIIERPTWRNGRVLAPRPIAGVAPEERLTYDEAREALRRTLGAGVTDEWLDAVDLLVVAALRAQLQRAVPPLVVLTGATRSGKGACMETARGILGLASARLRFDGSRELSMSIGEGLLAGAALLWADEVGKVVDWWHQSTALLQLSTEHTWRALHRGTVVTPVRAAVVLTGSTLPRGLVTMTEVAARAAVVRLPRVDQALSDLWSGNLQRATGNSDLASLRFSPLGAAIAEAWIEAARPLATGPDADLGWPEHAALLGAGRLGTDAEAVEMREVVDQLYRLWIGGPEGMFIPASQRPAGWMRCWAQGRDDAAAELLAEYVNEDDDQRERMGRLGRLAAIDVAEAAGLPPGADITLVVRNRGRRVAARFESRVAPASLDRRDRRVFPEPLP